MRSRSAPASSARSRAPSARASTPSARRLAHLRRHRRRPDRGRDGGNDERDRPAHARPRIPPHRPEADAGDPARGLAANPRHLRREAVGASARRSSSGSASTCAPDRKVTAIDAEGVTYDSARSGGSERIAARTVIWAAGVAASPLGAELARGGGAALDRAGRVVVAPDLSLPGHPEVSVVGDLAAALSHGPKGTTPVPGVSPAAKQMGRAAAANIVRRLNGEPTLAVPLPRLRQPGDGRPQGGGRRARRADLRHAALQRPAGVAVLAVRPHLLPDRLSQPADGDDRLGMGVLHLRARRSRRRRAGRLAGAARPASKLRPQQERHRMDTRTSPARLRIERIQEALREPAAPPSSSRRAIRTSPSTCPSAGRRASGRPGFTGSMATLVVTPERGRAVRRQPLLGAGRAPARRQRHRAGPHPDTGAAAQHLDWLCANVARGATVAVDGDVSAWPRRASCARRSRAAASPCAATSTSSPPPGPSGRRCRRRRSTSTPRREAPHAARRQAGAGARGDGATPARRTTSSRPSTTSPGCSTCAAPTSATTRSSSPTCCSTPTRRRSSSAPARSTRRCAAALAADGVRVAPYDDAAAALAALPAAARLLRRSAPDDARPASSAAGATRVEAINPSTLAKSRKSDAEAANVRRAMVEDGVAMCEFYAWFEAAARRPGAARADHRADDRREARRGARAPARLRRPELRDHRRLQRQRRDAALPRDAGIARDDRRRRPAADRLRRASTSAARPTSRACGRSAASARRSGATCTLVLRGTMALSRAPLPARHARRRCSTRSPARRSGSRASTTATAPATASATSSTSTRARRRSRASIAEPAMAMEPGMITSVEPGVYRPGQWGVRVENLVLNVPAPQRRQRVRRVPRVRDADALPDRHPLHRRGAAARRRDRLAQRLPRDGARAPGAAGVDGDALAWLRLRTAPI